MSHLLSPRAKPILVSRIQVEPFIAKSRFSPIVFVHHSQHQTPTILGNGYTRFRPDTVYSGRVLFIPDGYSLFRTDSALSERMQDIRGVSGTSMRFRWIYIAMQFPAVDKASNPFIPEPYSDNSYEPGTPLLTHPAPVNASRTTLLPYCSLRLFIWSFRPDNAHCQR